MWRLWFDIFLWLSVSERFGELKENELLSVVVIFRHGDRAPTYDSYPTNPNKNLRKQIWPDGPGQLTSLGKKQQYALGQWLRDRYKGFLPEKYNYRDIRVLSSDADRCLMSASANLAGLYPPTGDQIWNPDLLWMPIPIHTTPVENDPFIAMQKTCPKYNMKFAELRQKQLSAFGEQNPDFLDFLSKKSGAEINSFEEILFLYDTLSVESIHNLTLPEWSKAVYPDRLRSVMEIYWKIYTGTLELSRLRTGPLIDLIVSNLENVARDVIDAPKFLMISGHDTTLNSLFTSLKIRNKLNPEFASTLLFELKSTENRGLFINILYKNETYSNRIIELSLKDCSFDCEWNYFRKILEPLRIDSKQWEKECMIADGKKEVC